MAGAELNRTRLFLVSKAAAMGISGTYSDNLVAFEVTGPSDKIANSDFVNKILAIYAVLESANLQFAQAVGHDPYWQMKPKTESIKKADDEVLKVQAQIAGIRRITKLDVANLRAHAFGKVKASEVTEAEWKAYKAKHET